MKNHHLKIQTYCFLCYLPVYLSEVMCGVLHGLLCKDNENLEWRLRVYQIFYRDQREHHEPFYHFQLKDEIVFQ